MDEHAELLERWTHLYGEHLPALARAHDPVQKTWPVHVDHCFGRIVLDNAVGIDRPWMEVVKQPAVKNMDAVQLKAVISLAEKIATGEVCLAELDDRSLKLRGKKAKKRKVDEVAKGLSGKQEAKKVKKVKKGTETISSYFPPSSSSPKHEKDSEDCQGANETSSGDPELDKQSQKVDISVQLKRISESNITPFRKQMLTLLCQIPRGRYSTYQAMSDYVTKSSHKTCARAVGNAMRNNPFAPEVPCHRVLANDGTLGGFGGYWGESGKFANRKHELLHQEGVRFDSRGKVKGPPFREFWG